MKVSRVSEMRGLDRTAIDEFGIVEEFLMENAGLAVYSVMQQEFGIKDSIVFRDHFRCRFSIFVTVAYRNRQRRRSAFASRSPTHNPPVTCPHHL